jgi:hypothetical protein
MLDKPVRLDGVGEDPVIQAMLSDQFVNGSNVEATQIALRLQQLLLGEASALENLNKVSDALDKLQARMDKMDQDAERWENDRQKFLDEVHSQSEHLLITDPEERDRFQVQNARYMESAIRRANARNQVNQMKWHEQLKQMPKVTITSPGRVVLTRGPEGTTTAVLVPEEVIVKDKRYRLPPNRPVEVPKIVADILEQRRHSQEETKQLKAALRIGAGESVDSSKEREVTRVATRWQEIYRDFQTGGEGFPLPPGV